MRNGLLFGLIARAHTIFKAIAILAGMYSSLKKINFHK